MTLNISPETMAALRPHLDTEELDDATLDRISEESGIALEELREARDALWNLSGGSPARAGGATVRIGTQKDASVDTEVESGSEPEAEPEG
jgi:hypothetical protein